MYNYCYYQNNLCKLLLLEKNQLLQRIYFITSKSVIKPQSIWLYNTKPFTFLLKQLELYFAKKLTTFAVQLSIQGTVFEKKVWQALQAIPYGKTLSYGQLAKNIGDPNAARAVGSAANKNPLPIIIPCHRLIGAKGNLVGFAAGLTIKKMLLQLEGIM